MLTKIFIGTRLTSELRVHPDAQEILTQIPYEGKEYVGLYLETSEPTLQEIRASSNHLTSILQDVYPEIRIDRLPIVIFPQLFVG